MKNLHTNRGRKWTGLSAILLLAGTAYLVSANEANTRPDATTLNRALLELQPNTWLNLKPPSTSKPRQYSGNCFGGGYFWNFGGGHRGYAFNDVDLYDPRRNVWIDATEAEAPPKGSEARKRISSGALAGILSPTGRPFTSHTYQRTCWDPVARRFLIVMADSGTWHFDPVDQKWTHLAVTLGVKKKDVPTKIGSDRQQHLSVVYDHGLGTAVLIQSHGKHGIYLWNRDDRSWDRHGNVPQEVKGERYSTYIPEWKAHLCRVWPFDKEGRPPFYKLKLDQANPMAVPVEGPKLPEGHRICAALAYDKANHIVIVLVAKPVGDPKDSTIAYYPLALDPTSNKWTVMQPSGEAPQRIVGKKEFWITGGWAPFWYDPEHMVFLFLNVTSRTTTEMWAYRYRNAP